MERDLAAIKAKLASLESEASKIEGTHPEEAEVVIERITKLSQSWEQLTAMLTVRDAKLEEAGDLHRFLKDLDHFQVFFFSLKTSENRQFSVTRKSQKYDLHRFLKDLDHFQV